MNETALARVFNQNSNRIYIHSFRFRTRGVPGPLTKQTKHWERKSGTHFCPCWLFNKHKKILFLFNKHYDLHFLSDCKKENLRSISEWLLSLPHEDRVFKRDTEETSCYLGHKIQASMNVLTVHVEAVSNVFKIDLLFTGWENACALKNVSTSVTDLLGCLSLLVGTG